MRRIAAVVCTAAAIALMATGVFAQAKANFAGKWALDTAAAPAGGGAPGGGGRGGRGGLGPELTISQDATTLTLEYVGGGQAPAPVKLAYKLDGTESKNSVMMRGATMEQVAKAAWNGSALVVTTTTQVGEQKRTFSLDGANLVIETAQPGRDGGPGMTNKQTYKKVS